MSKLKSGFVAVVGRPNVGKSTLVNKLIGEKISIVTNKAQTTRNNIKGILNKPGEYQIVLLDTPGIHTPHEELDRVMNSSAMHTLKDADIILFLAPVDEKIGKNDLYIVDELEKRKDAKKILVLTKADTLRKDDLIKKVSEWKDTAKFDDVILISAKEDKNLDELLKLIVSYLPSDFLFFSEDQITDQPNRFFIKELIREQILFKTGQEVPHNVAVMIDDLTETETEMDIYASVYVERESQKAIIIGKQGKKISDIKYKVRKELKEIYGKDIHLDIKVTVKKGWRNSPSLIKRMGYDKDKY